MDPQESVDRTIKQLGGYEALGLHPPVPPGIEDYIFSALGLAIVGGILLTLVHTIAAMSPKALLPYTPILAIVIEEFGKLAVDHRLGFFDRLALAFAALPIGFAIAYPTWVWKRRQLAKAGLVGFDPAGVENAAGNTSLKPQKGQRVKREITAYQRRRPPSA